MYSTKDLELWMALQRHPGWTLLQQWLGRQLDVHTAALVRDDLLVPTRAARLQGRLETVDAFNRHLNFVTEQYRKRMEEG